MELNDVKSIMVLGDSISRGIVLDPLKKRYVFSKDGFIRGLTQKISPQVLDYSKFGTTTAYGKKLLAEKFDEMKPDLVLIEYGSNDSDYQWDKVAEDPVATHLPNLSLAEYIQNLTDMARAVRTAGKIPIFTNLHPLVSVRYFNWFTKNDPERQISTLVWLKDINNIYWWQEMYSYAVERTAHSLGVKLVNIRNAFLRTENYEDLMCEDGIHPTGEGQKLIEETFIDSIRRIVPGFLK